MIFNHKIISIKKVFNTNTLIQLAINKTCDR